MEGFCKTLPLKNQTSSYRDSSDGIRKNVIYLIMTKQKKITFSLHDTYLLRDSND